LSLAALKARQFLRERIQFVHGRILSQEPKYGVRTFPVLWRKCHKTFEGGAGHLFGMPRADIKTKQAVYTLVQFHAGLAGKFLETRRQGVRLKTAMMQVEAVLQMLSRASASPASRPSGATRATRGSSADAV
jgi:hypothetical protein